jgi:hypothetical protein
MRDPESSNEIPAFINEAFMKLTPEDCLKFAETKEYLNLLSIINRYTELWAASLDEKSLLCLVRYTASFCIDAFKKMQSPDGTQQ